MSTPAPHVSRRRVLQSLATAAVLPAGFSQAQASIRSSYWTPPQWAPHSATLISTGPMRRARERRERIALRDEILGLALLISRFEKVGIIVDPRDTEEIDLSLTSLIRQNQPGGEGFWSSASLPPVETGGRVVVIEWPSSSAWARETTPIFLLPRQAGQQTMYALRTAADMAGRSRSMSEHLLTEQASDHLSRLARAVSQRTRIEVRALQLDVDGQGNALLAWPASQHADQRDDELHGELKRTLGIERIIPLARRAEGRWVDQLARFAGPGVVAVDGQWANSMDGARWLNNWKEGADLRNQGLRVVVLPTPPAVPGRSYCGFCPINGALIIPSFGDPGSDAVARASLGPMFPDRTTIQLSTPALDASGGTIFRCALQIPAI